MVFAEYILSVKALGFRAHLFSVPDWGVAWLCSRSDHSFQSLGIGRTVKALARAAAALGNFCEFVHIKMKPRMTAFLSYLCAGFRASYYSSGDDWSYRVVHSWATDGDDTWWWPCKLHSVNYKTVKAMNHAHAKTCANCKQHGYVTPLRGHRQFCPYRFCNCFRCVFIQDLRVAARKPVSVDSRRSSPRNM